jgi:hypothetical protein
VEYNNSDDDDDYYYYYYYYKSNYTLKILKNIGIKTWIAIETPEPTNISKHLVHMEKTMLLQGITQLN